MTITRALISVSDKTNVVELAQALIRLNIHILATGGTASLLKKNNICITDVSAYTGFAEMMDGRLKTLHPKIHGGILARRGIDDTALAEHNITPIDLVIVNLYPFEATITQAHTTLADAIENIDIGGPTMLRSAAKNHEYVTVIVDPNDYNKVIAEIEANGDTQLYTRRELATKVFAHTAHYDTAIANYLDQHMRCGHNIPTDDLPQVYQPTFVKELDLRYGENPHQKAAFYRTSVGTHQPNGTIGAAALLQGKALSYNNIIDADAALACSQALDLTKPACVIVKHATPCGVAQATTLLAAYQNALSTDPTSAFGGIIAVNQPLDSETTAAILQQQFVEVILAPSVLNEAKSLLATKKNIRVLECGYLTAQYTQLSLKSVSGGLLVQTRDHVAFEEEYRIVTTREPTAQEWQNLLFAWRIVPFIKSNAIVYVNHGKTLGIGTGQTSRVFSAQIAALRAQTEGLSLAGAVMASDAFFPFADGVEVAAAHGITAVIQPGGSKRDNDVIDAANRLGLTMVMTGVRHFLH